MTTLTWQEAVEQARSLLGNRRANQMKIAELALQVCEITWGGSQKDRKGMKTIKDFAAEVGVSAKLISTWIAVKSRIYDKLNHDLKSKVRSADLTRAMRTLEKGCSSAEANKVVGNLVYDTGPDKKLVNYLRHLRSASVLLNRPATVALCKKETLEEFMFFAEEIIRSINSNSDEKILAKEHNLTAIYGIKDHGCADELGVSRVWKMNEGDRKIYDYLCSQNEYLTPIVVGMRLDKTKSKMAAKLWALRSLTKLVGMGLVSRTEKGQYKAKYIHNLNPVVDKKKTKTIKFQNGSEMVVY